MAKNPFTIKDVTELRKDLETKQGELRSFRFGTSSSKTKDVKQGRTLRRDIARILTELALRAKQS